MVRAKRRCVVDVYQLNGDVTHTDDGASVIAEFERGETLIIGNTFIPYETVCCVEVSYRNETETVVDTTCVKGCNSMDEPVIEGDMSTLEVTTGTEFDPLEGITAVDDNGKEVTVTVKVEGE